jgi:hypothetical protein
LTQGRWRRLSIELQGAPQRECCCDYGAEHQGDDGDNVLGFHLRPRHSRSTASHGLINPAGLEKCHFIISDKVNFRTLDDGRVMAERVWMNMGNRTHVRVDEMVRPAKRFISKQVKSGPFKGSIHVAPARHLKFIGQLDYLQTYLSHRLLPTDPEDEKMQGIVILLQNLLEHEAELLIKYYVTRGGRRKEMAFQKEIENGYVAFKTKMDWLLKRKLIQQTEWDVMEEVRCLRNAYAHSRPTERRKRYHYRGFQLLTNRSIRRLFIDTELVLRVIRSQSGRQSDWMTIPPGYASEMGWPTADVNALG